MTTATGRAYVIRKLQNAASMHDLNAVWDTVADAYKQDDAVKAARLEIMKGMVKR